MLTRLKRENEILKSEIAALKKNFKTFKIRSNLVSTMLMSPIMATKRVDRQYHRMRLNTLQFYGNSYDKLRQEYNFRKFFHSLWLF